MTETVQKSPCNNVGFTVWLTGLSGSGKSTIARGLDREFTKRELDHEILDGDVVRTNLSKGLGYSKEDRDANIRRIGFVCHLLSRNHTAAVAAAISPYRAIRDEIRAAIGNFVEVFVNSPLEVCEARDVKGLYQKARAGEIQHFTGISDPYEAPLNPEIECKTDLETPEESVEKILVKLRELGFIEK